MRYISFGLVVALLALPSTADARVKKIVIEKKVSPAFDGATFGPSGQYETIAGRPPIRATRSSPTSSWHRRTPPARSNTSSASIW